MVLSFKRQRSKFGKFLDKNSIQQQEISKISGVSRSVVSRLSIEKDYNPTVRNANKIIKSLRKEGYNVDLDDFWT
ncbi:helix-turn-helix transcriptional regulator (plasmid) [Bacillus carboniphilus]|uniref:Helix-turn-helix transcriptional regulator n=1 Tax=Bacillus carboniphilus TaxID=86663 RepID=A0ABY9K0A1_9BACI|nr:helix-turn-helix transcriptional regulator [Bacillus carboniphilus]WLR44444.1 helix-turn-helix transcriptional regulator [Bacillus carboniphilus]